MGGRVGRWVGEWDVGGWVGGWVVYLHPCVACRERFHVSVDFRGELVVLRLDAGWADGEGD